MEANRKEIGTRGTETLCEAWRPKQHLIWYGQSRCSPNTGDTNLHKLSKGKTVLKAPTTVTYIESISNLYIY